MVMTPLAREVERRMKALKMNKKSLSLAAGLNETYVRDLFEGVVKSPRFDSLKKLARALDCTVDDLTSPAAEDTTDLSPDKSADVHDSITKPRTPSDVASPWPNEISREGVPDLAAIERLPLDLPVYGAAEGGNGDADFELNGKVREWVRRPPGLMGVKDAFAVYVFGDSMYPKFEPGELVFIHPGRPPMQGRYVLVELFNGTDETLAGPALIKRFVSRSTEKLVLEQLNPPKKITIQDHRVKNVFLILRPDELFRA